MKFYKNLYFGEKAIKSKYKIYRKLKTNSFDLDTYLITLSDNPNNLLDIISSNMLKQPYFKQKEVQDNIFVIGIAKGKEEAYEVVRNLIDKVYKETGCFNIREYLDIKS